MMMNLFVIFDPSTSNSMELNWLSMGLIFYFCYMSYYVISSLSYIILMDLLKFMYFSLNVFLNSKFMSMYFSFMMVFIFIFNFLGLFPYIFTMSSHITFTLSFSLAFWMGFMIYGWLNYYNNMFSHLVPSGTPSVLMPFLVMIESTSLIIRPLTLSVRLAANMIAGHLLLCLIGSLSSSFNLIMMLMILVQLIMYMLEVGVSLIQAYVYSMLLSLYSSEVDFK